MSCPRESDTIAAIATATAPAGVGIVRLSGERAVDLSRRLLSSDLRLPHRQLVYARLRTPDGRLALDDGFVCAMYAPHSFTGEDVVEIHGHGGLRNLSRLLDAVLRLGARLATPGEFTRRAVLNGRMDLTRAEALLDIVEARSGAALELAHSQRRGGLAREIHAMAEALEQTLSLVEADLDFPDEEGTALDLAQLDAEIGDLQRAMKGLSDSFATGRLVKEGFRVALVGPPNAGKSTLFNALLGEERAIVTSRPGTTRDYLEEVTESAGVPLVLIDTAGTRDTGEEIERAGVARTWQVVAGADLVLAVLDASRPLGAPERGLLSALAPYRVAVVLTKGDLPIRCDPARLPPPYADARPLVVSGKSGEGLPRLRTRLRGYALPEGEPRPGKAVLTNVRHKHALDRARAALERARGGLGEPLPLELVAADLHDARRALGDIVGEFTTDDLLNRIFSRFCVGK